MLFVASGALLTTAVAYCKRNNLTVDLVCCPPKDLAIGYLRRSGIAVLETNDPNTDLWPRLKECRDGIAFSINNSYLLNDRLLDAGVSFFNIHNGLVQNYRGQAAVCVFAALCRGEQHYGVTLHRILPGQKVDSGPAVAQIAFDVREDAGFSDLMTTSLDACQTIFEQNVMRIVAGTAPAYAVELCGRSYTYKDVPKLCAETDPARLARATTLGRYSVMLTQLATLIEAHRPGRQIHPPTSS